MAVSVSTLNILLTGSAASLVESFHKGSDAAKESSEAISEAFSKVGEVLAVVGVSLSIEGAIDSLKEAATRIKELSNSASELGTTTEALSRLQFAAHETGVSSEQLTTAIAKMNVNLSEAGNGNAKAAAAFSQLGLNFDKLKAAKPDEAFSQISDAISKLQSPADRAAASVAIFGKSGAALLPLMNTGAAGIAEMSNKADELGVTVSSVDAQTVKDAGNAVGQVQDVVEGLANKVTIMLAPIVTDLADKLLNWLATGNKVKTGLDAVWTGITYGAAIVADVIQLIEADFDFLEGVGTGALSAIVTGFDGLIDAASWVLKKLFGTNIDTSGVDALANHLQKKTEDLMHASGEHINNVFSGKTAQGVFEYMDSVTTAAKAKSKNALDDIGKGTNHLIEDEKKKTGSLFGELGKWASEGWKAVNKVIDEGVKKAEEQSKKLDDEAKHLLESVMTPLEREQDKLKEVQALYASGHLTKDQRDELNNRLNIEINKDVNLNPKFAGAGSQEGVDLINQIQNQTKGIGKDEVAKAHLDESKKQTELLTRIANKGGGSAGLKAATI